MNKRWDVARKMWITDAMVQQETADRRVERWRDHVPVDGSVQRPSAPPSRYPSYAEGVIANNFESDEASPVGTTTSNPAAIATFDTISNNVGRALIKLGSNCHISDVSRTEVDAMSEVGRDQDSGPQLVELQTAESRTVQRLPNGQSARHLVGTVSATGAANNSGNVIGQAPATHQRPLRRVYPVPPARRLDRAPRLGIATAPTLGVADGTANAPSAPVSRSDNALRFVPGEAPPTETLRQATFVPMPGSFRAPGTPGHLVLPVSPPARPPRSPNRPLGSRRQPPLRITTDLPSETRSTSSGSHKRRTSDGSEGKESERTRA